MDSLKKKVVLITGASSGIGRGTAIYFAGLGSRLSLTGRNVQRLQETKDACIEQGLEADDVICVPADLTVEKERQHVVDNTIAAFNQLDVLVNSAGLFHIKSITETGEEEFTRLMQTNVVASFQLINLALPHLKISKGNIVNVSSIGSMQAVPFCAGYCMTKAALDCCTKNLALELAESGVRVNSVNPGYVCTDILSNILSKEELKQFEESQRKEHPLGRNGVPEDVAKCIAFLSSDMSSYVTGQIIFPAGGRNCSL